MVNYDPKEGRCTGCSKRLDDCSALPFHTMPAHKRDGSDVVVICTEYRQVNRGASLAPSLALVSLE
ncbi:hypothetical protein nrt1_33930 [Pseudomonas aeruginosa]